MKKFFALLIMVFLSGIVSCSSTRPSMQKYADIKGQTICRIALLPFINDSSFEQGDIVAQRIFTSELQNNSSVKIINEGDLRRLYNELRIYPHQLPDHQQMKVIAGRLGVDSLISGRIIEMEEKAARNQVDPLLAISLHVYDGQSSSHLWNSYLRKKGSDYQMLMHFGQVNTVSELCRIMSREIIEKWFLEGIQQCDS